MFEDKVNRKELLGIALFLIFKHKGGPELLTASAPLKYTNINIIFYSNERYVGETTGAYPFSLQFVVRSSFGLHCQFIFLQIWITEMPVGWEVTVVSFTHGVAVLNEWLEV